MNSHPVNLLATWLVYPNVAKTDATARRLRQIRTIRSTVKHHFLFTRICALTIAIAVSSALAIHGQTAPRFMGSVTAISGNTLTVKTDAGDQRQVQVPAEASLKRIEPGQKGF